MVLFYIEDRHLKSKMQLRCGGGGLVSDVCAAQMEGPEMIHRTHVKVQV